MEREKAKQKEKAQVWEREKGGGTLEGGGGRGGPTPPTLPTPPTTRAAAASSRVSSSSSPHPPPPPPPPPSPSLSPSPSPSLSPSPPLPPSPALTLSSRLHDVFCEMKTKEGAHRMLVVGHRGSGQNKSCRDRDRGSSLKRNDNNNNQGRDRDREQVADGRDPDQVRPSMRENTLLSFNSAVRHGADFVEFDVQVLGDGVPIIFHDDWIITEENGAKRIRDLSLEQFRSIGPQMPHNARRGITGERMVRRSSFDRTTLLPWECDVEDCLCTLAEALDSVPLACGFNVEMKYDEEEEEEEAVSEAELLRTVDSVMKVIMENGRGRRRILFSTFHPDAAVLLRGAQDSFPVFLLTDGGRPVVHKDSRRNSINEAIKHCQLNGLQGVVAEVSSVVADCRVVARIREHGLRLLTYGELNNIADVIYYQHYHGVDGVIVDYVLEMAHAVRHCAWEPRRPPFHIGKMELGGGGEEGGGDLSLSLLHSS